MPCLRGWLRLAPEPRKVVDVSTTGLPDWVVKQCEQRGIRATQRGLAEKAGTYAPTVKRVLEGRGDPGSVKAVAHALGMNLADFTQRVGYSNDLGPWEPPVEAHHLGAPEREALGVIIRAIANGGQQGWVAPGSPEDKPKPPTDVSHVRRNRFLEEGQNIDQAADDERYDEDGLD